MNCMPVRAAIIISCTINEADTMRHQARLQHRTVSGYILNILMRAVEFQEMALERWGRPEVSRLTYSKRAPGARTTVLLRCSMKEARRIRAAAKKRGETVSGYVLHAIRRSWKIAQVVPDGRSVRDCQTSELLDSSSPPVHSRYSIRATSSGRTRS